MKPPLVPAILCAAAAAGGIASAAEGPTVDLGSSAGIRVVGARGGDLAGQSVAGAGDFDGDGRSDVIVGAPGATAAAAPHLGSAYVVRGLSRNRTVDLAATDGRVAELSGAGALGTSVAGAGDVNGDGLGDVVVGAPDQVVGDRGGAGAAYVILGDPSPGALGTSDLGAHGFRIDGPASGARLGASVAGAGDVNGDGLADVIVAAPGARRAYVVFGARTTGAVDTATLAGRGYEIRGSDAALVESVGGGSDIDGDGRSDVVVGTPSAPGGSEPGAGAAVAVFGKSDAAPVTLADLGTRGFRVNGGVAQGRLGHSVALASDMNGDGRGEILAGAPGPDDRSAATAGRAYVVFGRPSGDDVDAGSLGAGGWVVTGARRLDRLGFSIAGAGDLNGDGRGDLVAGAPNRATGKPDTGAAYVLFGRAGTSALDIRRLGNRGYELAGAETGSGTGLSVGGAGDVDGDGLADAIAGAPRSGSSAGAALVAWRRPPVDFASTTASRHGQSVAVVLLCRAGGPSACRGRLSLALSGHRLGSERFEIPSGARRTVTVGVGRTLRRGTGLDARAVMTDSARRGGETRARVFAGGR